MHKTVVIGSVDTPVVVKNDTILFLVIYNCECF